MPKYKGQIYTAAPKKAYKNGTKTIIYLEFDGEIAKEHGLPYIYATVENENIEIQPCDFLFVPEIFSNVLAQTKKLPCKRVVILQNFNYLTEFMPFGGGWSDMGIRDAITTTERQAQLAKECFPYINTFIVPPAIKSLYYEGKEPKKMVVNIVAKNQSDVNRIVKPFYWKYPLYRWVSFRDLRGIPNEIFADALREAAITIWVDTDTNFGYTPLEAMKSGSIVIGKIPEDIPEWMLNEDGMVNDAGIWFDNINDVYPIIASVVRTWINDSVPTDIYEEMKKVSGKYTPAQQKEAIENVYVKGFFEKRKEDFLDAMTKLSTTQNNTEETDNE
jgi:hypothetical protein